MINDSKNSEQAKVFLPMSKACCCNSKNVKIQANDIPVNKFQYFSIGAFIFLLWASVYCKIESIARYVSFDLFLFSKGSPLGNAVEFFLYDVAKIFLLLVIMVYGIAWLRAGMDTERIKGYLTGKGRCIGYFLGSAFGAITPFCSCSSIPLFLGFTVAGIPLGITMAFLITSPLINEIAVVLLWGLLGWKFTVIYVLVGMFAGILGGIIMDTINAQRWLQPFLFDSINDNQEQKIQSLPVQSGSLGLMARHNFAKNETINIIQKVWKWVIIGVAVGATLHGYMPKEWFSENLGAGQWWSVPVAVIIGIPLYTNVTGIVPIMESLLLKGLPLGTTLAFCMSSVAVSLPEVMMLKQVMRWKLLIVFIAILLMIFTVIGWLFNFINI